MKSKQRIVVGMSGGVDSSVAAWLLKNQGYDVIGVFMKNWDDNPSDPYCSIKKDVLDAVAVADVINIDIDIVDFAKEYREKVFSYFLAEYKAGRTPNPDVLCNAEIKFKVFLDYALNLGADAIATGHYARKIMRQDKYYLLKGIDAQKDQSYFLYRLNQHQLKYALFPLGHYLKKQVREVASQARLPTAQKKDSTGICFIGERPFQDFLQQYLPIQKGAITTIDGVQIGEHSGLMYYTIGQRKGLHIGGQGDAWYVAQKDMANNRLIVVQGHEHPLLFSDELTLSNSSWVLGQKPVAGHYQAKTRYQSQAADCTLMSDQMTVTFSKPQWAITPGQSAVLYDNDICLGGGIITWWPFYHQPFNKTYSKKISYESQYFVFKILMISKAFYWNAISLISCRC